MKRDDDMMLGKTKKNTLKYIVWALMTLLLMFSVALIAKIHMMGVLPMKFEVLIIVLVVVFEVLMWLSAKKKAPAVIMSVLSVILTVVVVVGLTAVFKIDQTLDSVTTTEEDAYETVQMAVLVPMEDKANKIEDTSGYKFGYVKSDAQAKEVKKKIEKKLDKAGKYKTYEDFVTLTDSVIKGKRDAMIINTVYLEVLKEIEGYTDYDTKLKTIYTTEIKVDEKVEVDESKVKKDKVTDGKDKFIVYISGIDSYGSINVKSRSDVNILAVINTKSGKVQLINTPRDYFVTLPISGGMKDKLTHAGIYGVKTSVGTLENLYGVNVDYYFRINFSGFEKIINELGGIDVYSDVSFTSSAGYSFVKGNNHMMGKKALDYARTRKAFGAGDVQRGNNQMAVIKGVINKMLSTEFLKNYDSVLKRMDGCFQMDIPSDVIYGVVNNQLDKNLSWNIQSMSVTGTGSKSTTFSMPTLKSYVMIPNQSEVDQAKDLIKKTLK